MDDADLLSGDPEVRDGVDDVAFDLQLRRLASRALTACRMAMARAKVSSETPMRRGRLPFLMKPITCSKARS